MREIERQTILVTGATDGLGRALAADLAGRGATVLLHGRDDERGRAALEEVQRTTGNDRLGWYRADLSSLDQVRDTILHEIAHALVGPGHGHDAVWKRKCREVGARPERCGQADMPEGRWRGFVPGLRDGVPPPPQAEAVGGLVLPGVRPG